MESTDANNNSNKSAKRLDVLEGLAYDSEKLQSLWSTEQAVWQEQQLRSESPHSVWSEH